MSSEASPDSIACAGLHEKDLERIATELIVRSPTAYLCSGEIRELTELPDAASIAAGRSEDDRPPVLRAIENELYARFYVRPVAVAPAPGDLASHRDFLNALSAANTGTGTWEPGWHFQRREPDGRVVVRRNGVCFWTTAARVRIDAAEPKQDDACRVFVAKELRYLLPGFYFVLGDGEARHDRDTGAPIVRIYWNLNARASIRYLREISGALNGRGVPFRTKVLSDASAYGRADSGVLYLDRRDLAAAWPAVSATWNALRGDLGAGAPMFSRKLADGVGLADDPGDGRSFGQARSAILAQGLWSAFAAGAGAATDRVAFMRAAFLEHGLDPDRPHLRPGSPDYDVSLGERSAEAPEAAAR